MYLKHIPRIHPIIIILIILKICIINHVSGSSCPPIQNKTGPGFPYLPDSYQAEVEVNILDKGYTMAATIYYDFPGNRAVLQTLSSGSQTTIIYNYKTDEIFTLANSDSYPACTVQQLSTSNETQLFGKTFDNGRLHIGTAQTALKFGFSFHDVYIGNDTVRGIPVEHWRSCGNWSGGIITTDYYFSANWSTSTTAPHIPVRAEVRADKHLPNGTVYSLHHIYDYFSYRPEIDQDPSIFQTPVGVVCPGRVSTQSIPPITDRFYYRAEKVYPDLSAIFFEDVWYDSRQRLFRRDYKPISLGYPTYSMDPISEVHDYTRGVRYIIDGNLGNCTTLPITNKSMDAVQDMSASKINGSYVLDMKNPLQFFQLDANYTYIGQKQVRDALCDVYVTHRPNVYIEGFIDSPKTIITFYVLNQNWAHFSEGQKKPQQVTIPIKMDIQAVESGLSLSFNFVDFDPEPPSPSVFDISQCYRESSKLTFKMTFPGTIPATLTPTLLDFSQMQLANTMAVSGLRVTNLHLDTDKSFVYITATILDRTLASAQFTVIPGRTGSRADDSIKQNVVDYEQCATYCLTNDKSFMCNGFDYCSDRSCHLSRYHFDHGETLNSSSFCERFSRNVEGYPQETSLTSAFNSLRSAIYKKQFTISQFTPSPLIATDVAILFGWSNIAVSIPTLPTHWSVRGELSYPSMKQITAYSTWYDGNFKLLRFDAHVSQVAPPFYNTDPLSVIEDYNTGVKYVINKQQQNCTVTQVSKSDPGTAVTDSSHPNATWSLSLKSPMELFAIDNTYSFVGQQTIRGMTCNMFEGTMYNYTMPTANHTLVTVIVRYAFLAADWSETDAGYLRSTNQPISVESTIKELSIYSQYNLFDFNGNTQELSIFDTHQCFDANQTQPFQIVFPGNYHPALDTTSNLFIIEAVFKMANVSGVSPLRFQRTSLDHDSTNVYLTAQLVQLSSDLIYFTELSGGAVPKLADRVISGPDLDSCASYCLQETGFNCNSFYLCKESNQCLLSKLHVPDGPATPHINGCYSYSRTVKDQGIQLSNLMAFMQLKNAVYSGNLSIDVPLSGTENTQTYVALSVRNPIRNPYEPQLKEKAFQQFTHVASNRILKSPATVLQGVALDDCASACLDQSNFFCDGFSYYLEKDYGFYCTLTRQHPDLLNASRLTNQMGELYSRNYVTDFTKNAGTVPLTSSANAVVQNIQTDEQCAKLCYTNGKMVCRSFQFCQSTGQCLLFNNRIVGPPISYNGPECNHYASSFERDFQSINAGLFQFSGVVSSADVSVQACSKFCIAQQADMCKGFYYCEHSVTNCYLTSETPGNGTHVNTSTNPMFLCQQFSRIYYPPGRSPPSTSKTSVATLPTVTVKIPSTTPSKSTIKSTKAPSSPTNPPITSPPTTPKPSPTWSHLPGSATFSNIVPTPQQQKPNTSASTGISIGELVGFSVGMFIFGLVMGVVGLHFFRKFRGLDKDELKTNFLTHEDM